jgi:diguanylate cyclase (GGDEF)-like protein
MRQMKDRVAIPLSGDGGRSPASAANVVLGAVVRRGARSDGSLLVLAVLALALLPLGLATWAFGRTYRASEVGRTDARLVASRGVAIDELRAAAADATATATGLARSRLVQVALADGSPSELAALTRNTRYVHATVGLGAPGTTQAAAFTRVVAVTSGGQAVGHVSAAIRLDRVLDAVSEQTGVEAVEIRNGRVRGGELAGTDVAGPEDSPYDATLAGGHYRALRQPLGAGTAISLLVSYDSIDATVLHRQLLTLGAGALTLVALAIAALALLPRTREFIRSLRGSSGRRSPLALVGDVAVAAHDPHALLPVILETAVVATEAAGGRVVWRGEEIAAIGERGDPHRALVLALDEEEDPADSRLALYPGRRGLSVRDREIVESLVAQGRVALENARLQGIVQRQAHTDELTDLANRRRFMEALHQEIARATRFGTPLSLVLFDLDRFKRINDRCGHQVGDTVLRDTADVIRRRVRETDLPARIGGEEFGVILSGTDLEGALQLAESLRRDIERRVVVKNADWRATASFGVSVLHPGEAADSLIGAADRALYRAKRAGRNAVRAAEEPEAAPAKLAK